MNLGELETLVLKTIWQLEQGTVKAVFDVIKLQRAVTQNTVQSTLERLYRKQILQRKKHGHAFIYSSTATREELTAKLLMKLMAEFESDPALTLAAFIEQHEGLSLEKLSELETMLETAEQQGDVHG